MGGSRMAAGEGRRAPDQAVGRRTAFRTSAPREPKQEAIKLELDAPPPVAGGRRATELARALLAELCVCADGRAAVAAPQEGVAVVVRRLLRRGPRTEAVAAGATKRGGQQEGLCTPEGRCSPEQEGAKRESEACRFDADGDWLAVRATGKWCGVTFDGWRGIAVVLTSCLYCTHRSLYRTSGLFSDVLMLDTRRMEFSVVRIPSVQVGRQHAIVEAGEGTLRFLTLGDGVLDLYCKAWQDADAGAEEWRHERRIPLLDGDDLRRCQKYNISHWRSRHC